MNIRDLQKEAHAIAKAHGWWYTERTFGDLIALVHSELSEVLEAYRTWDHNSAGMPAACDLEPCPHPPVTLDEESNPVGVASELADVVIRVADMAEFYGFTLTPDGTIGDESYAGLMNRQAMKHAFHGLVSFGDWITRLHFFASEAWQTEAMDVSVKDALRGLLVGVQLMASHYGIDLDAAIEAKMAYNRTRPYRHGGKAL